MKVAFTDFIPLDMKTVKIIKVEIWKKLELDDKLDWIIETANVNHMTVKKEGLVFIQKC
jgi:hypothetical protein